MTRVTQLHPGAARADPAQRAARVGAVAGDLAGAEVDAEDRSHAGPLEVGEHVAEREGEDQQRHAEEREDQQRHRGQQRRHEDDERDRAQRGAERHVDRGLQSLDGERLAQLHAL